MNEIEKLQEQLKQTQLAYQMAAQMSEFKANFLARTSHELRSPLSSLIGLHQIILSDLCESPEEQKEFITQAYNSAMKLMALIDEIVGVSKAEYGTNQLRIESLQLADILTQAYNLTHLQAANRNLRIEAIPPDSSIYVRADRPRLIQSLTNLIDSGVAMMPSGKIKLTVSNSSLDTQEVIITIDFDCSIQDWQAETKTPHLTVGKNLEEIRELAQHINLSPKMRFMLSQTLLETMGGSLKMQDSSCKEDTPKTTITLICKRA